jgi:hypothetical protein
VCLSVHHRNFRRKNQLGATQYLLNLWTAQYVSGTNTPIFRSSRLYYWLQHMASNALVVDGRKTGSGQQAMRPEWGQQRCTQYSQEQIYSLMMDTC